MSQHGVYILRQGSSQLLPYFSVSLLKHCRTASIQQLNQTYRQQQYTSLQKSGSPKAIVQILRNIFWVAFVEVRKHQIPAIGLQLFRGTRDGYSVSRRTPRLLRKIFGLSTFPAGICDSCRRLPKILGVSLRVDTNSRVLVTESAFDSKDFRPLENTFKEIFTPKRVDLERADSVFDAAQILDQLVAEEQKVIEDESACGKRDSYNCDNSCPNLFEDQTGVFIVQQNTLVVNPAFRGRHQIALAADGRSRATYDRGFIISDQISCGQASQTLMTSDSSRPESTAQPNSSPGHHRPLVVGLTKPTISPRKMASTEAASTALSQGIEANVNTNTEGAGPAEGGSTESAQPKQKKEKAPKQPKPPKAAPAAAPTSPALIDLRVGHILRAIAHPNADSLYVSTIAMGDAEGTEHTQVDEETGKVVRTVCSGLNGLVPLAEMQDRKIIVVANLKPVNMRSIKSAAMVLAASPKQEEGADPHAPDRVVELVIPPEGSEAGDKVYFEGWPYGEGKGPEKQLNPKKKQWEAIQPGFYTGDDLIVGFDAQKCGEVSGDEKGNLIVEGKGACRVKTLKGAVVR